MRRSPRQAGSRVPVLRRLLPGHTGALPARSVSLPQVRRAPPRSLSALRTTCGGQAPLGPESSLAGSSQKERGPRTRKQSPEGEPCGQVPHRTPHAKAPCSRLQASARQATLQRSRRAEGLCVVRGGEGSRRRHPRAPALQNRHRVWHPNTSAKPQGEDRIIHFWKRSQRIWAENSQMG